MYNEYNLKFHFENNLQYYVKFIYIQFPKGVQLFSFNLKIIKINSL